MTDKIPLFYTFGNHMHWVDMQWLWGYDVLPDSIQDMLHLCNETGTSANINFDGIGYEKLANESPEALETLRQAIKKGQVEVVGGSYGQPYGLFHGSESNIRQRVMGVRTILRLFGVRPRTFWEEEFDFFPQLPQLLKGVGFDYASLFFQWTWHTPEIPYEDLPAIWWIGQDGSEILTAPRNHLNVHQWPEDFDGLLESSQLQDMPFAGIVQWLELMPSPDWMCRSELLMPRLKELLNDERFDIQTGTLSEYLDLARPHAEKRQYRLDDVWHGMSIGKNGDDFRQRSQQAEASLLSAESLSALTGLFGRPYPHWDVYPAWEIDEAWRELLSAQHHDNDECEGLCGHIGKFAYERSLSLSSEIIKRSLSLLAKRVQSTAEQTLVYNPLGWDRIVPHSDVCVPAFGYTLISADKALPDTDITETENLISLRRGALSVTVDKNSGNISQLSSTICPDGMSVSLLDMVMVCDDNKIKPQFKRIWVDSDAIHIELDYSLSIIITLADSNEGIDVLIQADDLPRPDGGMNTGLQMVIDPKTTHLNLVHDHPYGLSEIEAKGTYRRKYPTGEWMTSPQRFETVHAPFTALTLLDMLDNKGKGLLLLHKGNQGFFRDDMTVRWLLTMYDPWDEDYFNNTLNVHFRLVPHATTLTNTDRWRMAHSFQRPLIMLDSLPAGGDLPSTFAPIQSDSDTVTMSAWFRESEKLGETLPTYAGEGLQFPYVLRLVEFNGDSTSAKITLAGDVEKVIKTNMLGETEQVIDIKIENHQTEITIEMRPFEIATLYIDWIQGHKVPRNLDNFRHIWATIHRTSNDSEM